jgi:hypothetical protein
MAWVVNCDLRELGSASNSGVLRFEVVRDGRAAGSFRESFANFVGEPQDTVARCPGKCERCCVYIRALVRRRFSVSWLKPRPTKIAVLLLGVHGSKPLGGSTLPRKADPSLRPAPAKLRRERKSAGLRSG